MSESKQHRTDQEARRVASEVLLDTKDSGQAFERDDNRFRAFIRRLVELANDHQPIVKAVDIGDGVNAFFDDPVVALDCALSLRREFYRYPWELEFSIPPLLPRIALHAAGYIDEDDGGLHGRSKVITRRVEAVVGAGEIWATESFAVLMGDFGSLVFLGRKELDKKYGAYQVYRVALAPDEGAVGPASGDSATAAVELLRSANSDQQLAALDALGAMRGTRARRALERTALARAQPYDNRRMALLSLEEHESAESTRALIMLINSDDLPGLRSLAVQALSAVRDDVLAQAELIHRIQLTRTDDGQNPVAHDLAERAVLGLRHWPSPRAAKEITRLLDEPVDGIRRAHACVAAAAQEPDVPLMAQLAKLATNTGLTTQLRTTALEALISVHRRRLNGGSASSADASQEELIAKLLDERGSHVLRELALIYLSACETSFARDQLSRIIWDRGDPLRGWALQLAERHGPLSLRVPELGNRDHELFDGLRETLRVGLITKDRAGSGRAATPSTWPPARRPVD